MNSWICCQIGAREHYAIARSLHQSNQLTTLITDAWVAPQSPFNALPGAAFRSLRDRFHSDLETASVQAFTSGLLLFELRQKLQKVGEWERMIARNQWFQSRAIQQLKAIAPKLSQSDAQPILFTYSYAALETLKYAKSQGWYTVLGQIDPGLVEEKIVLQEYQKHPNLAPSWKPAPPSYWENWKAECEIVDRIAVNSNWSRQALQQAGIAAKKIDVIPLVYQPPEAARSFQRTYPEKFSAERPMRVLFLGQVILRKGIAALLEAAEKLKDQPIEFWLVGRSEITPPTTVSDNIRWIGSIPRSATAQYYQQADAFLFPTLSDGFGLTQLEAQAWNLPLIASKFCGEVVIDGVNGKVLPEVTGEAIVEVLQNFLQHPTQLTLLFEQSIQSADYNLSDLHQKLTQSLSIFHC